MAKKSGQTITLRIELLNVQPLVWRRLRVADSITLKAVHSVLQTVMGWENYHPHVYRVGNVRIGGVDAELLEAGETLEDEKKWKLRDVVDAGGTEIEYEYDFGDGWVHRLVFEPSRPVTVEITPLCVAGENACPPEDVGGPPGYQAFLKALADPKHRGHAGTVEWIGVVLDPAGFDLNKINRVLRGKGEKRGS